MTDTENIYINIKYTNVNEEMLKYHLPGPFP